MRKKHIYVGMDVHKETTVIALAHGGRSGKVQEYGAISSGLHCMKLFLSRIRKPNVQLHFVYESGPTGFVLQRKLTGWNEDCIVVSASHVPKKSGNKVKTDRRDAIMLANVETTQDEAWIGLRWGR